MFCRIRTRNTSKEDGRTRPEGKDRLTLRDAQSRRHWVDSNERKKRVRRNRSRTCFTSNQRKVFIKRWSSINGKGWCCVTVWLLYNLFLQTWQRREWKRNEVSNPFYIKNRRSTTIADLASYIIFSANTFYEYTKTMINWIIVKDKLLVNLGRYFGIPFWLIQSAVLRALSEWITAYNFVLQPSILGLRIFQKQFLDKFVRRVALLWVVMGIIRQQYSCLFLSLYLFWFFRRMILLFLFQTQEITWVH